MTGIFIVAMPATPEAQSPILPDATLLERLAERDSAALMELERRHRNSLYAQVYGVLSDAAVAEEVVRDTFMELWYTAGRVVGKQSASNWLRDMARELVRAELALRDPFYSTSIRRTDEADDVFRARDPVADPARRTNAGAEPPCLGYSESESGGSDGTPRDPCAW